MLKCLNKWYNAVFGGCKRTRKVQRMYLAFKNLKIKRKEGNHSSEKQETSKTDTFGVWSSGKNVCLMSLEVQIHKVVCC